MDYQLNFKLKLFIMRNFTLLFVAMLFASLSFAQNAPINFETGGFGASWTWTVFENDSNPPVAIVANPSSSGINTSATVAKFTALATGQPWAGCESLHGTTNLGTFTLDTSNNLIKIKVFKPVISDVGIKLVSDSGWALPEIKVANTLINQWEELTFDFSNHTNPPAGQGAYDQIVVFPDFNLAGRGQTNICYFDDITFNASAQVPTGPTTAAPTPPALAASNVISIFSNAFTNLANTDFNPSWGQSTIVTQTTVQSDDILKYASFNYQGTQFASAINASGMDYLHVDVWTADAVNPNIFCISTGPVEKSYTLTLTPNQWNSFDIPLSAFSSMVNMGDIIQFKFDGGTGSETIFLDNIYFYIAPPVWPTAAAPAPPVRNPAYYISVFSDSYNSLAGTDFNPSWGQSTIVSFPHIQNDTMIKYETFNYQGAQFAAPINASNMDFLHVDMWTADATAVNIFCISTGPVESSYSFTITPNQWVSYEIPMSSFTGVDLADVIQFKFDGGTGTQTIFLDNLYFYVDDTGIGEGVSKDDLLFFPNPVVAGQTVEFSAEVAEFKLFDLSGKLLLQQDSKSLSTTNLSSGMYLIELMDKDGNTTSKKLLVK